MAERAVSSRLATAEQTLSEAGVETPRLDAELLLAAAAGASRSEVIAGLVVPDGPAFERFDDWVARRARREPLQYIVGRVGFRRIELAVDERALIPRPETELLVAVVKIGRPCGIVDVGTGSGAVALALADELPDATVLAVDISGAALELAGANAVHLGLSERVTTAKSHLLSAVDGTYDAIAANLPYVVRTEIDGLAPEIVDHEPHLALDGGADGLDLVRRLAADAPAHLKPGGLLALEIGEGQAADTETILKNAGFTSTERHEDLAGIERVVSGFTPR